MRNYRFITQYFQLVLLILLKNMKTGKTIWNTKFIYKTQLIKKFFTSKLKRYEFQTLKIFVFAIIWAVQI